MGSDLRFLCIMNYSVFESYFSFLLLQKHDGLITEKNNFYVYFVTTILQRIKLRVRVYFWLHHVNLFDFKIWCLTCWLEFHKRDRVSFGFGLSKLSKIFSIVAKYTLLFCIAYICETVVLAVSIIKPKYQSTLENTETTLYLKLSSIQSKFNSLCKNILTHLSHSIVCKIVFVFNQ